MNRIAYTLALIIMIIPALSFSQSKVNLKGKYDIGLNIGMIYNTSEVVVDVTNVSTDLNFHGSFSGLYWLNNDLAFHTSIGYMGSSVNSEVAVNGVLQETSVILPIHFGVKYAPDDLSIAKNIRPYISGMIGVVRGECTENIVNVMSVTSNYYVQGAFSVKSGIGADALIGKYFRLGLMFDYLYMADFEKAVGTRKNYSGFDLYLTFGIMM